MAKPNPSLNSNYKNPRNQMEIFENNTKHLKQEINDRVDSLIASINSQRMKLLNQVDSEFHKAREVMKNFESKNAARIEAKERLAKQLEGDLTLLSRLTSEIDEELSKMEVDLPNFKIQWNSKFIRFCEEIEEVGQLTVNKHSQIEVSSTPLWSTLNRDNEVGEPKAIAIDEETSNIYVGDASRGKILVMNRMGEYLNTLIFKKPSSISRMMICQNQIYCRTNNFFKTTLYRLDKNTGELLSKYNNIADIHDFTALPDKIFLCDMTSLTTLLPDLSKSGRLKLISPYIKVGSSLVLTMKNVGEELVMIISEPTNHPIQIFDKKGTFLRAIAEDIPLFNDFSEVYICIDEHWNIILSIDGIKLVNIYNKDGKFLTSVGQEDEKSGIYHPRGIALDTYGNLVVCNNRNKNILQAYKMTN